MIYIIYGLVCLLWYTTHGTFSVDYRNCEVTCIFHRMFDGVFWPHEVDIQITPRGLLLVFFMAMIYYDDPMSVVFFQYNFKCAALIRKRGDVRRHSSNISWCFKWFPGCLVSNHFLVSFKISLWRNPGNVGKNIMHFKHTETRSRSEVGAFVQLRRWSNLSTKNIVKRY